MLAIQFNKSMQNTRCEIYTHAAQVLPFFAAFDAQITAIELFRMRRASLPFDTYTLDLSRVEILSNNAVICRGYSPVDFIDFKKFTYQLQLHDTIYTSQLIGNILAPHMIYIQCVVEPYGASYRLKTTVKNVGSGVASATLKIVERIGAAEHVYTVTAGNDASRYTYTEPAVYPNDFTIYLDNQIVDSLNLT